MPLLHSEIETLTASQKERLRDRLLELSATVSRGGFTDEASAPLQIAAFLTLDSDRQPISSSEIDAAIRRQLPEHMAPKFVTVLDQLPKNRNGKTDKSALRNMGVQLSNTPALRPPSAHADSTVATILSVWKRALGLESLSTDDDFFRLGGDSILAIRVISELRKLGFSLSVSELFKAPTVAGLALRANVGAKPVEAKRSVDNRSPREAKLLQIWRETLRNQDIDFDSDFFAAGGDSLLAISLVSKLRKAGVDVSVSQLFKHPTLSGILADLSAAGPLEPIVSAALAPTEAQNDAYAPVPFTPIQSWFFERGLAYPNHWNQSILLELDPQITFDEAAKAFAALYRKRDALRLRVVSGATGLRQMIRPSDETPAPISQFSIANQADNERERLLERLANDVHASIDLASGQLLKAIFIQDAPNRPNSLLLIAHHYCVDAVSWSLLLDDLRTALVQKPLEPPRLQGSSFADWARKIERQGLPALSSAHVSNWLLSDYRACPGLPLDKGNASLNTEGSATSRQFRLSVEQTKQLLRIADTRERSPLAFMIAAVALALRDWNGASRSLLGIEGHGRSLSESALDGSDTVGWLTTYYPLLTDLTYAETAQEAFNDIRTQMSVTPDSGIAFGLLKHGRIGTPESKALAAIPEPQITLNYLGNTITDGDDTAPFRIARRGIGQERHPQNQRTCVFEINALITDGVFQLDWRYSSNLHEHATVESLLESFATRFAELINSFAAAAAPRDPEIEAEHPLTDGQQSILLHHLSDPKRDLGQLMLTGDIEGETDLDSIFRAWQATVAGYAALRSAVDWKSGRAASVQVYRARSFDTEFIDLSAVPDELRAAEIANRCAALGAQPMRLDSPEGGAFIVFRRSPRHHTFIWRCHHLFIDGWSGSLVIRELIQRLNGRSFSDSRHRASAAAENAYRRWLSERAPSQSAAFWRSYLAELTPTLLLPADHRGAGTDRAHVSRTFDPALASKLKQRAAALRASSGTLVIAAWSLTLASITGQRALTFGLTHSGRDIPISDTELIVGNLANTVPFRASIDSSARLDDWVRKLGADQHSVSEQAPFTAARILNWCGYTSHEPLFDTSLSIASFPPTTPGEHVRLENYKGDTTSRYAASLSIELSDRITAAIEYASDRLSAEKAERILNRFAETLERICATNAHFVSEILFEVANPWQPIDPTIRPPKNQAHTPTHATLPAADSARAPTATEAKLIALLEPLLMVKVSDPTTSFFALGGTSVQAIRWFSEIERALRKRLPVSTLFKHSTIAQIADLIDGKTKSVNRFRNLVETQAGADQLPLFLIHAGGTEVLFYRSLIARLDPNIPIFGLQPIGHDGREFPPRKLSTIVKRYVAEIRSAQPHGPYRIVGHCFGGLFAIEIARQLRSLGESVPLVISIDGPAPRVANANDRAKGDAPARERPPAIKRVRNALARRLESARERVSFHLLLRFLSPARRQELVTLTIKRSIIAAVRNHMYSPFTDDMTLIRCSDTERFPHHTLDDWSRGAPAAEILDFDCGHDEILAEPHVERTAACIAERIQRSQRATHEQPESVG